MKLKNNALQEVYDAVVNGTITISTHAESPIDKAFRECDEKIQKDIDIWKCGNEILLSANSDLASIKKKLEKEIEKLKGLHDRNNILEKSNGTLLGANMDLCSENRDLKNRIEQLKKDLDDAKSSVQYFRASRNDMERRAKLAEEVLHTTEEVRDNIRAELESKVKRMDEITKDLVDAKIQIKYFKESRDDWQSRVNNAEEEIEELKEELKESQKDYDELTSQYQKLTIENKKLQDGLREIGYDQGQTELWDALQNVRDVNLLEEFDPECETLGDILDMDLEDFLDTYKKWQEEKEKGRLDYMRDYLTRFCEGRVCKGCPLESTEYKCGCGYSFRRRDRFDTRIIPDEDIKRYYEKARGCGRYTLKNATFYFDNKPYTMEAKVEINKDLLEKVCGIKLDKETHKLEYGDAVRLPWRDYDYMYIGPDEEEETIVRMFDPKNHAIVTSHIANVRYNGGKIVLTSEDDLRKIWKAKK